MDNPRYEVIEDGEFFYIYDKYIKGTVAKYYYRRSAEKRCAVLNRNWRKHQVFVIKRVDKNGDDKEWTQGNI